MAERRSKVPTSFAKMGVMKASMVNPWNRAERSISKETGDSVHDDWENIEKILSD